MRTLHAGRGCCRCRALGLFLLVFSFLTAAQARAQSGNLMVADFEGAKVETKDGLALIVMADEQLGGTSNADLTLIHPGADGSRGALRISFHITGDFPAPFDGAWALVGKEGLATDLTAYKGVRFYARSKEGSFVAGVGQFAGRTAFYTAPFETRAEWTLVELPFDKFHLMPPPGAPAASSPPPPLEPKAVVSFVFSVSSKLRGQYDLEIDQVQLYR